MLSRLAISPWRALCVALAVSVLSPWAVRAERIEEASSRLLGDVKFLASDELEGRGVGTEGLDKAAEYIRDAFAAAGLDVTVEGGDAYQEFEVIDGAKLTEPNVLTLNGPDGESITLELGKDFTVASFGGAGVFDAPIVFCGYGIEAKELEYDSFAGVDVKDKVVVIMRRTPQQANPHGLFAAGHGGSRHAALRTKVSNAFQHGAAAVLFVNDPYSGRNEAEQLQTQLKKAADEVVAVAVKIAEAEGDTPPADLLKELRERTNHYRQVQEQVETHNDDTLMEFGYGGTRGGKSIPILHITQDVCDRMLKSSLGKSLAEIEAEIDETGEPQSALLSGWKAEGQTSFELVRVPVRNVIGVLEGSGPHADETIVIGAHYDHVGLGGEGSLAPGVKEVHNGADDNASGTAALIELARRLGARKKPLPRRLVFIAFTGEERGLLGSAHYVREPVFPLESTVAMFNMDMVGRLDGEKLTVFGAGTSSKWEELLDRLGESSGLELVRKPEGFGPSDHSSFYAKEIPVIHLFTGTHTDYHRPSDDWDKLNVRGMARIVDLLEAMVVEVASADERPDYVAIKGKASLARSGSRPYFGSIPDFGTEAEGYAISGVSPESPAAKGGLKGGDVIIRMGGQPVGSLDDFDLALRKFSPGQEVEVVVLRDKNEVKLKVTLAAPRS
ncbi:M28 family peptidase [Maioricimonas sp. JC845]|uniref:M28 family peptidase n=1 Tax=Maioricimonas sp. JC845 TaxID=3232138 RepID=UPI0034578BE7